MESWIVQVNPAPHLLLQAREARGDERLALLLDVGRLRPEAARTSKVLVAVFVKMFLTVRASDEVSSSKNELQRSTHLKISSFGYVPFDPADRAGKETHHCELPFFL